MSCTPRRPHASKRVTFGLASRKERLKQPHLSSSALARLASELAVRSLEPSTRRGYGYALKHWSTFTKVYSVAHLPSRSSLALFVAFLSRRVKDQDKVLSALAFHFRPSLPDWDSIRSAPEVLQVLRGARKTAGVSVRRSPPLLPLVLVACATPTRSTLEGTLDTPGTQPDRATSPTPARSRSPPTGVRLRTSTSLFLSAPTARDHPAPPRKDKHKSEHASPSLRPLQASQAPMRYEASSGGRGPSPVH